MADDENSAPRVAFEVTSERVTYHGDTVEYFLQAELNRCASEGIKVTRAEIEQFRTDLVKTLVIRHQAEKAANMHIKEKNNGK